ncbi:contractile injection system protein, VgrG/Pvc8 family [Acidovorax radicis]|uniref:contractile injection system protein, VgrG/Pvc8 family n=1 Tax=Acidovorax radicis TaxID=758826 RepID=UPI0002377149|nr:contractile injection system protein, VgrG/Pvc8 family [Acidovorax radicis]
MAQPDYLKTNQLHRAPTFTLVVDGRDISKKVEARLVSLTLTESRGDEADQLDLEIDDSDGRMGIPAKGAELALALGWEGSGMQDKGTFEVDEVEHSGTPDTITVRARSADLRRELRTRAERSYHGKKLGEIVGDIAQRNGLQLRMDDTLANTTVEHIDQTRESDLHFLTRLAKKHDSVATVKKGRLVFKPIGSTKATNGDDLETITITRADGDRHRYHSADRNAYSGVRAYWHDPNTAEKRSVLVGEQENEKRLKDTYGSEADAMAAARAERGRIERGQATMELDLAIGRPDLMPQTPVELRGYKDVINETPWLTVKLTHRLGDGGLTTRMEMETRKAKKN